MWLCIQHIQNNNLVGVESLLNRTPTPVNKDKIQQDLCHPLCMCAKCGRLWAANWEAEENAQVTVYSRDDRGYTGRCQSGSHFICDYSISPLM